MGILAGIFAAALLQDLSFTAKTALVSRGHRTLAVAADVCAMLTSSLYLILTASVTMRSGLSFATAEAFAAIAIGGACGTIGGMFAVECLERRLTRVRPISERIGDQRQDGRLKTAGASVRHRPSASPGVRLRARAFHSRRPCLRLAVTSAVNLAVSGQSKPRALNPKVQGSTPRASTTVADLTMSA